MILRIMPPRFFSGSVLAVFAVGLAVLLPASPAAALSCVGYPDDVEQVALSGRQVEPGGYRLFERYGLAVVGTVAGISPSAAMRWPWSDDDAPTQAVAVDVLAGFGRADVPARLTVANPDPRMFGYSFEAGRTYFIPLKQVDGQWRSFLCDPIREVAPDQVPALKRLASMSGIQVARFEADGPLPPPSALPVPSRSSGLVSAPVKAGFAAAAVLLVTIGAGRLVRRRRRALTAVEPDSGDPKSGSDLG
jgi:hypothetical protein